MTRWQKKKKKTPTSAVSHYVAPVATSKQQRQKPSIRDAHQRSPVRLKRQTGALLHDASLCSFVIRPRWLGGLFSRLILILSFFV